MQRHDLVGQGKANSKTFDVTYIGSPKKRIINILQFIFRNAYSVVRHMNHDFAAHVMKHHIHLPVGRKLGGILNNIRSEEHTSELQSLMRISYAVFCLKKKK